MRRQIFLARDLKEERIRTKASASEREREKRREKKAHIGHNPKIVNLSRSFAGKNRRLSSGVFHNKTQLKYSHSRGMPKLLLIVTWN